MDWKIFAAAMGWGAAGASMVVYREWRERRTNIEFVPDGKGGFEDSILRWERRAKIVLWVTIVGVLVLGYRAMFGLWPFGR